MTKQRGKTEKYICKNKSCKCEFTARVSDRKRGWAQFCSKSCKAKDQERRTGQYSDYVHGKAAGVSLRVAKMARKVGAPSVQDFVDDAREYGGIPQYSTSGKYEGFVFTSFEDDF